MFDKIKQMLGMGGGNNDAGASMGSSDDTMQTMEDSSPMETPAMSSMPEETPAEPMDMTPAPAQDEPAQEMTPADNGMGNSMGGTEEASTDTPKMGKCENCGAENGCDCESGKCTVCGSEGSCQCASN